MGKYYKKRYLSQDYKFLKSDNITSMKGNNIFLTVCYLIVKNKRGGDVLFSFITNFYYYFYKFF